MCIKSILTNSPLLIVIISHLRNFLNIFLRSFLFYFWRYFNIRKISNLLFIKIIFMNSNVLAYLGDFLVNVAFLMTKLKFPLNSNTIIRICTHLINKINYFFLAKVFFNWQFFIWQSKKLQSRVLIQLLWKIMSYIYLNIQSDTHTKFIFSFIL